MYNANGTKVINLESLGLRQASLPSRIYMGNTGIPVWGQSGSAPETTNVNPLAERAGLVKTSRGKTHWEKSPRGKRVP